jgi:hypothetical protein
MTACPGRRPTAVRRPVRLHPPFYRRHPRPPPTAPPYPLHPSRSKTTFLLFARHPHLACRCSAPLRATRSRANNHWYGYAKGSYSSPLSCAPPSSHRLPRGGLEAPRRRRLLPPPRVSPMIGRPWPPFAPERPL